MFDNIVNKALLPEIFGKFKSRIVANPSVRQGALHHRRPGRLHGIRRTNERVCGFKNCNCRYRLCGIVYCHLLAQHHKVTAVDIVPEKVELINHRKSPIQDAYIEQ